jgi:hypothetical protein
LGVPALIPSNAGAVNRRIPRSKRVQLDTMDRVRRELSRLYVAARDGERDVADASKLGNMLGLIGRIIEGTSLEERLARLEAGRG